MLDLDILTNSKMIGIGCSTFGGSNSKATASRVLHHAYEQGIIYFDVARSYGYGAAESIIGNFAAGKRDKIFIASKFGISPPAFFPFRDTLLAGMRSMRMLPSMQRSLQNASAKALVKSAFSPQLAEKSLNKSLKELNTDYIDIFLFHDVNFTDVLRDDVIYILEKAKEQGKIRSWGGTFYNRQVARMAVGKKNLEVMQIPFGLDHEYSLLTNQNNKQIQIIYSVLKYNTIENTAKLNRALIQAKNNFPQLQAIRNIRELLLLLAFHCLPEGVILLSMSKPEQVDRNKLICQVNTLSYDDFSKILSIMRQAIL